MNPKHFHSRADRALSLSIYDPKKLVLMHTGVTCLLAAVVLLLNYILEKGIGATASGLSGMGTRAILSTIQSILEMVQMIFIPFWSVGYTFASLQIARGYNANPRSLLQGFGHIGSILVTTIFIVLSCLGMIIAASIVAVQITSFLPIGKKLLELAEPLLDSGTIYLDEQTYSELSGTLLPFTIISMTFSLITVFAYSYRYRLVYYCILDQNRSGKKVSPIYAGKKLIRGHKMDLFRLDLHFWWYYLILALITVLAYGDIVLAYFGVSLPWNTSISAVIFYMLYIIGTIVVSYCYKNTVSVAYASFYDELIDNFEKESGNDNSISLSAELTQL